jgi:hypothetical protein
MNHKKMYRQIYGCGQLLDNFEKSNDSLKSPTKKEYDDLPPDIKDQYANYEAYKKAIDDQNVVTRNAMKVKIAEMKTKYTSYTGGSASEKSNFDSEADALIATINTEL